MGRLGVLRGELFNRDGNFTRLRAGEAKLWRRSGVSRGQKLGKAAAGALVKTHAKQLTAS